MTSPRTCPARSAAARVPCAGEHTVIDGVWKHQSADGSLVWVDQRVPAGPDPIEWTDHHGDVWEESPVDRQMIALVRFSDGTRVPSPTYHPRPKVEQNFGELVQTAGAPTIDDDVIVARYLNGECVERDGVPIKNTEPIVRSEFDTFTPEQKKLVESAAELENISVMVKEAVLDLRNAARTGDVADAYARVYFLRRELGRVVAALGVGVPRTLATIEAEYRELTEG